MVITLVIPRTVSVLQVVQLILFHKPTQYNRNDKTSYVWIGIKKHHRSWENVAHTAPRVQNHSRLEGELVKQVGLGMVDCRLKLRKCCAWISRRGCRVAGKLRCAYCCWIHRTVRTAVLVVAVSLRNGSILSWLPARQEFHPAQPLTSQLLGTGLQ